MKELKENIIQIVGKDPAHIEKVLQNFSSIHLKRNEYILREHEICRKIYYVKSGLMQVFKIDQNGNEKTIDLIVKDEWFTDLESFKNQNTSSLFVRTTKKTVVYHINHHAFTNLMQAVPKFAEAYMKIIEKKYKESMERISAINVLAAHDKIEWLRKFKPELFSQAPDRLIASYLGISKETYSRQKMKKTASNVNI